jgi:hypothetical protein
MRRRWGFSEDGERVLLAVSLGMRESFEDWQALGRDLISRGLGAMLIVADGAPGLVKAIEQCWPASDRQRRCVHRARNLYTKLPDRERERVKHAYWQALDEAINEQDPRPSIIYRVPRPQPARADDQPGVLTASSVQAFRAVSRGLAGFTVIRLCERAHRGSIRRAARRADRRRCGKGGI